MLNYLLNSLFIKRSMVHYKKISKCRICGCEEYTAFLDLGTQALTGVFPKPDEDVPLSPISVIKCNSCHSIQLEHTTNLDLMYGQTYGYESALNMSMVNHLKAIHESLCNRVPLKKGSIVLDIGSNDGTLISLYSDDYRLIGIDPSAEKFLHKYRENVRVIVDFFSKDLFIKTFGEEKASIVTSIACFYDVEDPVKFAKDVSDILDPQSGVWCLEVAYLPTVLNRLAFDGICQEHLLFYSMMDIQRIAECAGLKVVSVSLNDVNGGSFQVVLSHKGSVYRESTDVGRLIREEKELGLLDIETFYKFSNKVENFKKEFMELLTDLKSKGKSIYGLGASTKFNVILQYCGVSKDLISAIGEVNTYKYGRVAPGTGIPIISEDKVLGLKPDYLVVGPYHFMDSFLSNKKIKKYRKDGGKLIVPLPDLKII